MLSEEFEKEVGKRLEEAGITIKECRSCKRRIFFIQTKEGRIAPLTLELRNHFIDCPDSKYFKKRKNKKDG